jgi:hypothetical protein
MKIEQTKAYKIQWIYEIDNYEDLQTNEFCHSNSLEYVQGELDRIAVKEGFTETDAGTYIKRDEDWVPADGSNYTQTMQICEFDFVLAVESELGNEVGNEY